MTTKAKSKEGCVWLTFSPDGWRQCGKATSCQTIRSGAEYCSEHAKRARAFGPMKTILNAEPL